MNKIFTTKDTFSVSELEKYKQDPKEYYNQYILKLPQLPINFSLGSKLAESVHGDIIHKLIEQNAKKKIEDPGATLESVRISMELPEIPKEEIDLILKQFENYLKSGYAENNTGTNELPFLLKIDKFYVTGKIDMLIKNGKSWEIVDFKATSKKDFEQEALKYKFQLQTYALAVTNSGNFERSGKYTLLFLSADNCTPYSGKVTEQDLMDVEKDILKTITKIKNGKF